jgi:hypothetical protein
VSDSAIVPSYASYIHFKHDTSPLIILIYFTTIGRILTLEKKRDFLNVEPENLKDSKVFKNVKKCSHICLFSTFYVDKEASPE